MIDSRPLVSVLMTAYNREAFIGQAIESVLSSSYTNFELIVVDDVSRDGTVQIAREMAARDKRVKVYVNDKNLTDYPNRNKAASYANGKYLKYVDSDDILYPYGLEMMVYRMECHPEAAVGLAKRGFSDRPFPVFLQPRESYYMNFMQQVFLFVNAPTSAIIRRDRFEEAGGFSGVNQFGDYEFWLKMAAHYPILLMEGDVSWDRDHPGSEKNKDDIFFKTRLWYSITKAALTNENNPLPEEVTQIALKRLRSDYKKFIVSSVLRGNIRKGLSLVNSI